jgi:hypothetical protein
MIPFRRFGAVRSGLVRGEDFKFGESARVPGHVSIPNRDYMNLLELPLLFYVVGLLYFVTNRVSATPLVLSWIYVGLRYLHSAIHLTYNNVIHRLIAFASSNFVLLALWIFFFAAQ